MVDVLGNDGQNTWARSSDLSFSAYTYFCVSLPSKELGALDPKFYVQESLKKSFIFTGVISRMLKIIPMIQFVAATAKYGKNPEIDVSVLSDGEVVLFCFMTRV